VESAVSSLLEVPSELVLRTPLVLQFLIIAMLMVLSVGAFGFPSRAHADNTTAGVSSLTPTLSGPLVATSLFQHDVENASRHYTNSTQGKEWVSSNYVRLTEYAWAVDPLEETDTNRDYYIVFASATVQAKGNYVNEQNQAHPWCLYNRDDYGSQSLTIKADTGTILSDTISPVNVGYGKEIASRGFNLGLTLSGGEGSPGVSAGISWSQTVFDWTTTVTSVNSTVVSWRSTIAAGPIPGVGDCNKSAWVWGYAAAISVDEGQTPSIEISLTGTYYVPDSSCNLPGFWDIIFLGIAGALEKYQIGCLVIPVIAQLHPVERASISTHGPMNLSLPPAVSFETNPLVGSITLNGTEFLHGQHGFFLPGKYLATAMPPESYIFDHWETYYGGHGGPNPAVFDVTGNGFLRAVFAAKLTLLTDPPDIGSISIASSVGGQCGPRHPNGDWAYVSSLPPKSDGLVVVCANAPAGYTFDHWSSTGALSYRFKANDTVSGFYLTGPSTIKAWFNPKTCCPGVIFNTNLNNNGGPALMGGSILIGTQDVTNSRLYFARGRIIEPLAVPSEGYVFDHWDLSGVSLVLQDTDCGPTCGYVGNNGSNPGLFNVTGTCCWYVTAHFALKITFETNPQGTGSISWGGCGPNHPGHQDGDWVLENPSLTLYPPNTQTICANTPAGYKFDHWTTTSPITGNWERPAFAPYNSTTQIVIWMTPFVIKAWFTSLPNNASTAPSLASAPSSLVATGQYGHVDLAWNSPLTDGGSPVTGYKVYRGDSFTGLSLVDSIGYQLWYQDASVTNGQVYYYRVTAINSVGEGPSSNTDSARPGIDRITIAPDPRSVLTGAQVQFSAFARTESGEIIQGVSFSWTTSVPSASITDAGLFKAGTIIGTFAEEVSASAAGVNGYATVIVQAPPGTRASTASLPFDSLGPWTLALIPGAVAVAIGVLGVVIYRKKTNRRLPKQP